jgi:tRNA (cytidine/uridine-2'-O-)-methyltransferase
MRLALYQPDIPQNTGTLLRLAACLGLAVDVIGPCGFVFSDKHFRRAGMDYLKNANFTRHVSWDAFQVARAAAARLVLLTTKAEMPYTDFGFEKEDVLLLGSEGAGVPDAVHRQASARLRVPMAPGARSLNVAVAAAMVLGEALRQTGGFEFRGAELSKASP